jgi:phosphoribosyl 1,2-cyclic phosphate phosphodiesterase
VTHPDGIKVTFLGTGPSSGVPGVGIGWGDCNPENPRNRRLRQSLLVDWDNTRFLIDTTPDLRTQLLSANVTHLDAVLYTHAHADHMHGLDDLRGINKAMKKPLPVFADGPTHQQLLERFSYALKPLKEDEPKIFVRPVLEMTEFNPGDDISPAGRTVKTFDQDHGYSTTVGYVFDRVAYSTDVKNLTDEVLDDLTDAKLDLWIIGVFQWTEHWTHADVEKALRWVERVKPRRTVLTHLGLSIDYDALMTATPDHVLPAFDGMTITIERPGGAIKVSE